MGDGGGGAYISVIVPIFNAERYLGTCIESIVRQSYRCLEILLVDDGSTDGSGGICDRYGEKDNRVRVIHKGHGGLVAARKTGIANATGSYVTFVDADDWIEPDAYGSIIRELDPSGPDLVVYGLVEDYLGNSVKKKNQLENGLYVSSEIKTAIFPQMLSHGEFFHFGILPNLVCKMIKRSFLEHAGVCVDDRISIGEDAAAVFHLLVHAGSVQAMDLAPYHYCKRNGSMMWERMDLGSLLRLRGNLSHSFYQVGCLPAMQRQLDDYMDFVTLLKAPRILLDRDGVFKENRVALYGAGGFGQAVYFEYQKNIPLWVDINDGAYRSMGLPVKERACLIADERMYDVVYIAILDAGACRLATRQLVGLGVKKPILSYVRER